MKSIAVIFAMAVCCATAFAEPAQVARGLAGRVEIEYPHRLRARAEQSPMSPVMVRVTPIPNSSKQMIEFIGSVAGAFDLRDYVERQDGESAKDLPTIPVTVVSRLLPEQGTDLYASSESWVNWRAHYRELLWGLVLLWVCVPIAYFVLRARRKQPGEAVVVTDPAITLEDRLRAALALSASRTLTVEECGQLELLVFRYLAERSNRARDAEVDAASVLQDLRSHPETRGLVAALERWLHTRGGETGHAHATAALEEFRRSRLNVPTGSRMEPAEAVA